MKGSDHPNVDLPGTTERDWREYTIPDSDNDGITDDIDEDDDNDGIPDADESCAENIIELSSGTGTYTATYSGPITFSLNGGDGGGSSGEEGGSGATIEAVFNVTAGDIIRYVIGAGSNAAPGSSAGGGGKYWVIY